MTIAPMVWRVIDYEPHEGQLAFHASDARFKVPVAGRRWGKSRAASAEVEPDLLDASREVPCRGWIVGPQYSDGEKEFRYLWEDLVIKMGLGPHIKKKAYNVRTGEMYIQFPWGARVDVKTGDRPDGLVGEGLDFVIMSEAAKQSPIIWEKYLRPALADRRGKAIFPSTPEGFNWYYNLYRDGQDRIRHPDWESWRCPSWQNKYVYPKGFDDPEIQSQLRTPDDPHFWQEIGADFRSVVGLIFPEWNDQIHIKSWKYNPLVDNYLWIDFGYCVDEETEILTRRGWLKQSELLQGDETLGYDMGTGFARWVPIQKVSVFTGLYEVIKLEHKTHSSVTTTNHRWPTVYGKFVETQNLKKDDRVPRAVPVQGLLTEPKYTDALVELAAWLWTEGQLEKSGFISIWQNEGSEAQRIRECLTELFGAAIEGPSRNGRNRAPAGWKEREHRSGALQFQLNMNAAESISDIHEDKLIRPEFIVALTKAQLLLFIEASFLGDGFVTSSGTQCISQKNRKALDAIQMACQLLGIPTNIYPIRAGEYHGWQMSIRRGESVYPALKPPVRFVLDGTVWCPTTETGTWLARREGKVYFTGNTNPTCVLDVQVTPSEDAYIWREYYVRGKTAHTNAMILRGRQNPEGYRIECGFGDAADPQAIEEYSTYLAPTIADPESKDWARGIQAVKRFLRSDDGNPRLFVDPSCVNTIREFNSYKMKQPARNKQDPRENLKEEPQKKDDHAMDAIRYGIMHLFELGAAIHADRLLEMVGAIGGVGEGEGSVFSFGSEGDSSSEAGFFTMKDNF